MLMRSVLRMKAMESIQDLIEEAKLRTVWWALCIFAVSYFLSHTSKSMWMNIPIAILFVSALRILFNEVDFRWKDRSVRLRTHLSHLEKKQLSVNDSRLSTMPPPPKWKRKIDSPVVEAAMNDFIDKILKDFVVDLWYSEITPDSEFPQHIHAIVMDALGEISGRVKELNLVDLLTRDIVDLIGNHLDTFRRNQAAIGIEVMETLSSEERDERLKHHLMASKELHPALISPESEYKVLQRLIGGVLAVVLRPREAQSPLIRSIARELVTCLVVQPVMNFACPAYINELIEYLLLAAKDDSLKGGSSYHSTNEATHPHDHPLASGGVQDVDSTSRKHLSSNQGTDTIMAKIGNQRETSLDYSTERPVKYQSADWARMLEAATQRRTEVLTPENLENLWTKGRNYKKKEQKNIKVGSQDPIRKGSGINCAVSSKDLGKEMLANRHEMPMGKDEVGIKQLSHRLSVEDMLSDGNETEEDFSQAPNKESYFEGGNLLDVLEHTSSLVTNGNKHPLKRSNSTSALIPQPDTEKKSKGGHGGLIISEFYGPDFGQHSGEYSGKTASDVVLHREAQEVPKLKCRVMGAYFEKLGSKSFAVYSIAVTDAENKTWFVKRRYRNFERLHRHLKDIPNYTLHLPPKRIFSSSTEDAFVHQRCIQLDKYLQDLLSIANVAEQHEVWDFLSVSSKNYSFGKSSSVMRTLAVNVDDAVDDIVRQFRGVSDGLVRKVVGPSPSNEASSSVTTRSLPWNVDEINRHISSHYSVETTNSFSDNDEGHKDENDVLKEVNSVNASGWHSDNEVNSKSFPPRVIKHSKEPMNSSSEKRHDLMLKSGICGGGFPVTSLISDHLEDPVGMPPEWTPPNVSVPLLNLVDNIFQLKRRGWLRRQVFWISKQILQLIMEDAIDDWLLRQIHWLRRDEIIAQGIQWIQDILWPDGTFFLRVRNTPSNDDDTEPHQKPFQTTNQFGGSKVSSLVSFEQQLQAARRASDVKKMLFDGAPTALVSLIGQKQYRRCARDIYYFTQSSICVKNLAYEALELLLVSVFPELTTLVRDVHGKMSITRPI